MIDIQLLQAEKGGDINLVIESEKKRFADPKLVPDVLEMYKAWVKSASFVSYLCLCSATTCCGGSERDYFCLPDGN